MAVELMRGFRNENFPNQSEENAVKEAASGLESVEKLIRLLSESQQHQGQDGHQSSSSMEIDMDCRSAADMAVTKFKRVISLLGRTRTGHARFRRAPLGGSSSSSSSSPINHHQIRDHHHQPRGGEVSETKIYSPTPIQQVPLSVPYHPDHLTTMMIKNGGIIERKESGTSKTISFSYSPANSFISSLTGDGDSKQQPSSSSAAAFQITNLSQVSSAGKPPLSSSSFKRKCSSSENGASGKCSGSSGRCHCSKKRKLRLKRVVRVPAISLKLSDIPPDDYSWRKYGQKPIKGSPHPRGYYKCSSVRGCPARKHVERALDDPTMLVVTYEGEHNHSLSIAETAGLILESS